MSDKSVTHEAILSSMRTLKDGTLSLTLQCQEMDAEKGGKLFALNNEFVKFIISKENITDEQVLKLGELELERKSKKSPAQRLRAVLFVLWEQTGSTQKFDDFYELWMERVIDMFKQKLD